MTTIREEFDLESSIAEIILNAENGPKAQAMIRDLCRRCADEALERAAGLAAVYETIETGAISDKILALKHKP